MLAPIPWSFRRRSGPTPLRAAKRAVGLGQ